MLQNLSDQIITVYFLMNVMFFIEKKLLKMTHVDTI